MDILEIRIGEFRLLRGKGHEPLHDDECFTCAVIRALNPINIHQERISKELKELSKKLNWEGTEFPTPLNNIKKFEENNNIGVKKRIQR